jgi:hypothetical protein
MISQLFTPADPASFALQAATIFSRFTPHFSLKEVWMTPHFVGLLPQQATGLDEIVP